jgi:oligosaccharide repeat unit polymerase
MRVIGSPWLAILVIAVFAGIARAIRGSWLAPSAFSGMLWSIYLALPLIFLSDAISFAGPWIIVGMILCLQIGAFISEEVILPKKARTEPWDIENRLTQDALCKYAFYASLLCAAFSLVGAIWFITISLREFGLSFSSEDFLKLGGMFYSLADQGEFESFPVRALMMGVFPSALLGGIAYALSTSRLRKLLCGSAFIPALLFGATVAMRMGILIAACCWISGYLTIKSYLSRGRYQCGRKGIAALAVIAISITVMYSSLQVVRGQKFATAADLSPLLAANFFGYECAFDTWTKQEDVSGVGLGRYTFAGIFDLLGAQARARGLYSEVVTLTNGIDTNIFTAFRGLIEDLTFPGALIASLCIGLLTGGAYSLLSNSRLTGMLAVAAFYNFLIWSPIVSVFNYNGVIFAWLLTGYVIYRTKRRVACHMEAL